MRLSITEAATALRIPAAQVFALSESGELAATDTAGVPLATFTLPQNCRRVPVAALTDYLARNTGETRPD